MRLLLLAFLVLLASGCGLRQPIRHSLVLEPDAGIERTTVTVVTELETDVSTSAAVVARVDAARREIIDARDPWSARFASIEPESDRLVLEKTRGVLRRAERSAVVATEELQRFFADTGVTIHFLDGQEWSEVAVYAPASTRATRQQRDRTAAALRTWSDDAARYFRAVAALYRYLDVQPQRATPLFERLFGADILLEEEEEALVDGVGAAMERIFQRLEAAQTDAFTIDEDFDLVYNPFPAEIVLRTPAPIVTIEGFERQDERTAVIPRRGLFDAVMALEGRWIEPDPLALLIRSEQSGRDLPEASTIAAMARRAAPVDAAEIEEEFARYLSPPRTYRLRWRR